VIDHHIRRVLKVGYITALLDEVIEKKKKERENLKASCNSENSESY